MCAGAIGLLRVPGMGHRAARDSAALHLPSLPLRRHPGRDLEDQLQGAPRVNSLPLRWQTTEESNESDFSNHSHYVLRNV